MNWKAIAAFAIGLSIGAGGCAGVYKYTSVPSMMTISEYDKASTVCLDKRLSAKLKVNASQEVIGVSCVENVAAKGTGEQAYIGEKQ